MDAEATVGAIYARWHENLAELMRYVDTVVPRESFSEITRLADQYMVGRAELFTQRIEDCRIVDGHGDLLSEDIFCLPEGAAFLDCLEFDDRLRYVDGIDDAAFLAMDLEFLGRKDLGQFLPLRVQQVGQRQCTTIVEGLLCCLPRRRQGEGGLHTR